MTREESVIVATELQKIFDDAIEEIKRLAIERGCEFDSISEWPLSSGNYLVNIRYE